jgi:membrane-associated phospholipid phosphatase
MTLTTTAVSYRVAKLVTELLSPFVVVFLLPMAVAWHGTGYKILPTLLWGLVVAVFSSVLPMIFIVRGARRGHWEGHHVRNREGRLVPMTLALVSTALGLGILLAGAPRDVIALDVSMLGMLIACLVITRWWKISLHAAVSSGAVATLALIYGPALLLLAVLVVLVCWSRVRLADHTTAQVMAGAILGPVLGGALFLLVR